MTDPSPGPRGDGTERPRILCVDDEPSMLSALARTLRPHYQVITCAGGREALAILAQTPSIPVIVSDLHMPGMTGVELFAKLRQRAPDTVRVLLTGMADTTSAINAVNEGQVFRFLLKPYPPASLLQILDAAIEQHRLITSERVLLQQTVHGTITALTDLLAIAQPDAFGRAVRLKRQVEALARELDIDERWQVEVAAMLSQVGYIAAPPEVADRVRRGVALTAAELAFLAQLPGLAERLIEGIPRLEGVRTILHHQDAPWERGGAGVPIGARLLKVANDYDVLEGQSCSPLGAARTLEARTNVYDPAVLAALRRVYELPPREEVGEASPEMRTVERSAPTLDMALVDVRPGMRFASDVVSVNGFVLVARGQEVTPHLLDRIHNVWSGFASAVRVRIVRPELEPGGIGQRSAR